MEEELRHLVRSSSDYVRFVSLLSSDISNLEWGFPQRGTVPSNG